MISKDSRHRNILMLSEGEIDERLFPGWSMGCHELAAGELMDHGAFDLTEASLEAHLDPDMPKAAIEMMRQFYRTSDRFTAS
jgi:hypothetical protein